MYVSAQIALLQASLELSSLSRDGDGLKILMIGGGHTSDYGSVPDHGVTVTALDSSEDRVLEMRGYIHRLRVFHVISGQDVAVCSHVITKNVPAFSGMVWLALRKKEWNNNRSLLKQPIRRTPTQRGK